MAAINAKEVSECHLFGLFFSIVAAGLMKEFLDMRVYQRGFIDVLTFLMAQSPSDSLRTAHLRYVYNYMLSVVRRCFQVLIAEDMTAISPIPYQLHLVADRLSILQNIPDCRLTEGFPPSYWLATGGQVTWRALTWSSANDIAALRGALSLLLKRGRPRTADATREVIGILRSVRQNISDMQKIPCVAILFDWVSFFPN
jgi:hypothetical protein